jgi:hypothetical protein
MTGFTGIVFFVPLVAFCLGAAILALVPWTPVRDEEAKAAFGICGDPSWA